jgi:hypothetical protein
MWKCPYCNQTSNRPWNLQTHIKRKHYGLGDPNWIGGHITRLHSMKRGEDDNNHGNNQYQTDSRQASSDMRSKNLPYSLRDSIDFVDEAHELIQKYTTVKNFLRQTPQNSIQSSQFSWTVPSRGLSVPPVRGTRFPRMSFALENDPLIKNVIAYKGYVCKYCVMKYINPVYWLEENRQMIEPDHSCNKKLQSTDLLESVDISYFVGQIYQSLREDLKKLINQWTKGTPCLVSHLLEGPQTLSRQSNCMNLTISARNRNQWANRTLNYGRTFLKDFELFDFLRVSANQSYNCFNVCFEETGYAQGPFLMRILNPYRLRFPSEGSFNSPSGKD